MIIRRATLEDKPAIFDFLKIVFKDRARYKFPERWEWQLENNPFRDSTKLPVWIAMDKGRIIGQTCAMVEPFKIGNEIRRVGWSYDTFVLPEYRGQAIGYQLQKENQEGNEIFMSLSMSRANRRIKAALGSIPIDGVSTFIKRLRFEPTDALAGLVSRMTREYGFLRKVMSIFLHWVLVDRATAVLLNLWIGLQDLWLLRRAKVDDGIALIQVETFGKEVNALWEKVSLNFYAIVKRDALYLNWKFVRQPHMNHVRFIARRRGDICGYLILRKGRSPERSVGIIVDIFVSPDDEAAIRTLLAFGVRHFRREKVEYISVATTIAEYKTCLWNLGFKKTGDTVPMFHCETGISGRGSALKPGSWFFSKGDHDWDQYPLA